MGVAEAAKLDCRLRALRRGRGLSQADVARAAGCDQSTISHAEGGEVVGVVTALKIAAFFGKTVEELWKFKDGV